MQLRIVAILAASLAASSSSFAGPYILPGDSALRHDIQLLADYGVIKGPTTTWPLAWGPIAADISDAIGTLELPRHARDALARVRMRAEWEMRTDEFQFRAEVSGSETPTRTRSFQNTPRESAELSVGTSYTGDRFQVALNGQIVDSPVDGKTYRADQSSIGVALGNYTFSVNTLDRWWGPGWDGSLILSSNARPIPALTIDRTFTDPFRTKWLSWLGPWDLSAQFGQMESNRAVPNTRFFGLRMNFRPTPSLEFGLSRTAQWCGDGRPCGLDTFVDLLLGRDNVGDGGITPENEPGNQLAGFDVRWSLPMRMAVYGQFIGEDEAGGFPSRYLGQGGFEFHGGIGDSWSFRWFVEAALTNCEFTQTDEHLNCAYNNAIYETGYRYRGRVIAHGADNDSRVFSAGITLVDDINTNIVALLRFGELNRLGPPDPANSLTPTLQDILSFDVSYRREFRFGILDVGAGVEQVDDIALGVESTDARGFLRWRSSY